MDMAAVRDKASGNAGVKKASSCVEQREKKCKPDFNSLKSVFRSQPVGSQ